MNVDVEVGNGRRKNLRSYIAVLREISDSVNAILRRY